MIGGPQDAVDGSTPIFRTLAPGPGTFDAARGLDTVEDDRARRVSSTAGPSGAGHFVKMIHNGIEYGLMQAYAEGFDICATPLERRCPRTSGTT